ncbi:methionine sulfoxide reductase [Deinococcus aerophilus]|uniref:Methionine sulfoxide reductase n=2 Tax=Deinococcus aerophilus TaxID=522488 RepID=A0ABQ2GZI7_9DEIO|nr:methionine sulfoxide reductase [Deinococcus aerophilus]
MHDWAGQVAIFPRDRIDQLLQNNDFACPGLYILVGENQANFGKDYVYVGETESLSARIKQHINSKNKTFWKKVIILKSVSGSLNKAHIKSLEAKILKDLSVAGSVNLTNQNKLLAEPHLASHDHINVAAFMRRYKLILRSLGFKFFSLNSSMGFTNEANGAPTILDYSNPIFELKSVGVHAFGRMLADKFVISKDSTLRHIGGGFYSFYSSQLIQKGILVLVCGSTYKFTKDSAFTSPSQAASILTGTSRSGWATWKIISTNITMRQWSDEMEKIFGLEMEHPDWDGA